MVEKRVYDRLDDAGTVVPPENETRAVFRYTYDEPATNDAAHSEAAGTSKPYVKLYREFRGHALVTELGPDGRVRTTWFHQDDARAGRAQRTHLGTQTFWDPVDYAYDAYGRVVTQTVPYDIELWDGQNTPWRGQRFLTTTLTTYDVAGRVLRVTAPDGSQTRTSYGDLTQVVTDTRGLATTTTTTDLFGRVVQVAPPVGAALTYTYGPLDRLTTVQHGASVRTTIGDDQAGRKTELHDADVGTWRYAYDGAAGPRPASPTTATGLVKATVNGTTTI